MVGKKCNTELHAELVSASISLGSDPETSQEDNFLKIYKLSQKIYFFSRYRRYTDSRSGSNAMSFSKIEGEFLNVSANSM